MRKNSAIGFKILECGLMTLYRNQVIIILMSMPTILVTSITAYVLFGEYETWTAGGSVVSMFNPYLSIAYSISQSGKYLIPLIYMLIPAAYAISDIQGGFMLKVLPVSNKVGYVYKVIQMSLIIVLSVLSAYLAFMICIRIIEVYRPLLDLCNYDTLDNMAVFLCAYWQLPSLLP